ncbi:peptide ABC transporter substrate-binding protein [Brachyspira intermedia]|uniref:peptide ABC transporter substrate-binding protein n=1 Tax=Brachyspira intermedia TaxID=84377 RepID=UPI0030077EBB
MHKKIIIIIITLILIISCKNNNESKDIIINIGAEPRTIDPTLNTINIDGTYILNSFEGLTKKDKDNNIIPGVAEKWDISEDGLTYTFYLRTNSKWSDGKPVTAHDFVYSWQRVVNPKVSAPFAIFVDYIQNAREIIAGEKNIEELGIKAIDDYTLEVILNNPTAYFLDFTGYFTLCPVRKDIIEKYGDNWTLNPETYIGNGAFKMIERKVDDKIVMVKNTNYWDTDNVKPEKITFIMMDDTTSALAGIKGNTLHLSKFVSFNNIPDLQKENLIETIDLLASSVIRVDLQNEVLKDIKVRKALSLAIDRDYIIKNVTFIGEYATYYTPTHTKNYNIVRNENYIRKDFSKNVEEAKKLLAEAGYPDGKGFPVIDISVPIRVGQVEVAEAIQSMWKEYLGIDITINKYEQSVYSSLALNREFKGLVQNVWTADFNDPIAFLSTLQSYSSFNYLSYTNKEYDNLLNIANTNNNLEERTKLLYQAENILVNDVGIIPLYYLKGAILKSHNLKGVEYDPGEIIRFDKAYLE